jgi:speckle-type POZ protein
MQHLLVAADRYGVDRLMLICKEQLCDMINMDTVKTILALANQHSCKQLKEACLASPQVLGAILKTDGFKEHFMMDCRPLPLEWGASSPEGRPREEEVDPSSNFKRIWK